MIPGEEEGLVHDCQWFGLRRLRVVVQHWLTQDARSGRHRLAARRTSDPDAVVDRALKIGATTVHPLADQSDHP